MEIRANFFNTKKQKKVRKKREREREREEEREKERREEEVQARAICFVGEVIFITNQPCLSSSFG